MAFSIWKHGSFKNAVICGNPPPALLLWVTGVLMAYGYMVCSLFPLPMTERDVIKAADNASSPVAAACIKKTAADTMRVLKEPLANTKFIRLRGSVKLPQNCIKTNLLRVLAAIL